MQIFAMASAIITIIAGSWVGIRLVVLSRRTGQAPERYIGFGMLAFAGIAYPLFLVGVAADGGLPFPLGIAVSLGAHAAYFTCLVMLALFTRMVFRRESKWGFIAVGVLALIELVGAGSSLSVSLQGSREALILSPAYRWGGALISGSYGLVFLWASIEAFIYRSALMRRLALGLADPVVVNRFTVWILGTGAACAIDVGLVLANGLGLNPATNPIPALLQSSSGLICSLTWMLTFAPTDAYLNWVRRRAEAAVIGLQSA